MGATSSPQHKPSPTQQSLPRFKERRIHPACDHGRLFQTRSTPSKIFLVYASRGKLGVDDGAMTSVAHFVSGKRWLPQRAPGSLVMKSVSVHLSNGSSSMFVNNRCSVPFPLFVTQPHSCPTHRCCCEVLAPPIIYNIIDSTANLSRWFRDLLF